MTRSGFRASAPFSCRHTKETYERYERHHEETVRGKTLSLKKTETSTVKQSFSHGRTKAVVVEKKRTLGPAPPAAKTR